MSSIQETLQQAGFEPSVADIYVALIENGELSVPSIKEQVQLSRAAIYEGLNQLMAEDFVEYRKEGRNAFYKAAHPNKLFGLIEQKKREIALFEGEMKETIETLTGAYNVADHRPGVRFFDGKEGFGEALSDTLSAEEIYTYIDLESVKKHAQEINKPYVEARRKKGINKKLLILDTPENRAFMEQQGSELSDFRFLPKNMKPFKTGMQIYKNRISYFTLREKNSIVVIIDDPDIYTMHKHMFEYLWDSAKTI